jgi:hypothetical protein
MGVRRSGSIRLAIPNPNSIPNGHSITIAECFCPRDEKDPYQFRSG